MAQGRSGPKLKQHSAPPSRPWVWGWGRDALFSSCGRQCYKLTTPQCKKHAAPAVVLECSASARPARPSLHRGALPRAGASHAMPYIEDWSAASTALVGHPPCLGGKLQVLAASSNICGYMKATRKPQNHSPHAAHTRTASQPASVHQPASLPASQTASQPAERVCQLQPATLQAMGGAKRLAASGHGGCKTTR